MHLPSTHVEAQRRGERTETGAQVRWDTVKGFDCAFDPMDKTRASGESKW